jgi:hypothetical protein
MASILYHIHIHLPRHSSPKKITKMTRIFVNVSGNIKCYRRNCYKYSRLCRINSLENSEHIMAYLTNCYFLEKANNAFS